MNSSQASRPLLFLYFFRLFALLGAVPFLINTVDILLHLTAPSLDPFFDPVMRFLLGLVVAPLTLVVAGLCIRRAPGNLIGWMLVTFAYGISVQVIRAGLLPLNLAVLVANRAFHQRDTDFLLGVLRFFSHCSAAPSSPRRAEDRGIPCRRHAQSESPGAPREREGQRGSLRAACEAVGRRTAPGDYRQRREFSLEACPHLEGLIRSREHRGSRPAIPGAGRLPGEPTLGRACPGLRHGL